MAISGKPGLYKFVSQAKNGVIVESLIDNKRIPAYASEKLSALEDIAVYTESGEVKLSEIYDIIFEKEKGGQAVSGKSEPSELKSYFEGILPEYDKEKVYVSDIKKIISWYNLLQEKNLLQPSKPEEEETGKDEGSEAKSEKKEKTTKSEKKPEIKEKAKGSKGKSE
jgi:hypothetical protein